MSLEGNERFLVRFEPSGQAMEVEGDSVLLDLMSEMGIEVAAPCGGQGRCGRCKVQVKSGEISQPPNPRLTPAEREQGYVLACQAKVLGNAVIAIPPRKKVSEAIVKITSDKELYRPEWTWAKNPSVRRFALEIEPPSLADNTSDLDRVRRSLTQQHGIRDFDLSLSMLHALPSALREAGWTVTVSLDDFDGGWTDSDGVSDTRRPRLVNIRPGKSAEGSLGMAVDIGTTTVTVYLVRLSDGAIIDQASAYNGQLDWGDDIISRIIYSQRGDGLSTLQRAAVGTINELLAEIVSRTGSQTADVDRVIVAGNTTMIHLFLGINPKYIREEPYIPALNHVPVVEAGELGLGVNKCALVQCLPGIGSYVGADITAGVLSSRMYEAEKLTLFIDVGTNGEIVLGNSDWLISCACSAGPAFEGGGVKCGMRATNGAIDDVWVDSRTMEPTYNVIGDESPKGICGSGMIAALADMFITGVVDKAGKVRVDSGNPRLRKGESGGEYVIAWASESATGEDIVLTEVDINNLIRTKAAIYAGFSVLLESVGLTFDDVEEVLIAGSFGKYINIEKAIQIGLLPDMSWDRFKYLGNTSVLGSYIALMSHDMRKMVDEVASKMTYLELSADNRFMDQYMSALFLPHTDFGGFPSVRELLERTAASKGTGKVRAGEHR